MAEGRPLGVLLREARARLAAAGSADPGLEARLIVEHLSGTDRAEAIRAPERLVPGRQVGAIEGALARRIAGEPVHRILGHREFYGLRLKLSPETLEPRPDTETLVDLVLPFVRRVTDAKGRCRVLDLGTGTGAIALAILSAVPQVHAVGVDVSEGAVATAAANAAALGLGHRFEAIQSDWFDKISGRFDAIVSNPPYIAGETIGELDRGVRDFDPHLALDGGTDGLDAYRAITAGAADHLEPEGRIAVEIGFDQRNGVKALFDARTFRLDSEAQDLGGRVRSLCFACWGSEAWIASRPLRVQGDAWRAGEKTLGKCRECG